MSPLNVKRELKKFPLKTISSAFFRQVHLTNPSQFLQFLFSQAILTNASIETNVSIIIVYEQSIFVNAFENIIFEFYRTTTNISCSQILPSYLPFLWFQSHSNHKTYLYAL